MGATRLLEASEAEMAIAESPELMEQAASLYERIEAGDDTAYSDAYSFFEKDVQNFLAEQGITSQSLTINGEVVVENRCICGGGDVNLGHLAAVQTGDAKFAASRTPEADIQQPAPQAPQLGQP